MLMHHPVHILILMIVLSVFILKSVETNSGKRNKRILYGLEAYQEQRDLYPSFRYSIFLAKSPTLRAWEPFDWIREILGLKCPIPYELIGAGVLLTPSIVQTACHCISRWYVDDNEDENVTFATPLNVWEDRIYSFFGNNRASRMFDMLVPSHYITYLACRRLNGHAGYVMFDYGLIISKDSVNEKAPSYPISYAPVYKISQLQEFYYRTIQQQYTCLFIGHGGYMSTTDEYGYQVEVDLPSDWIRWGWRPTMNYDDCMSSLYTPTSRSLFFYNYTRDATWVCHQGYYEHDITYKLFVGDSGGPVTCNEVYFSITSFVSDVHNIDVTSYSSPIASTHFENAAEFRENFIRWCADRNAETDEPLPHPEDGRATVTPPPFLFNQAPVCHRTLFHFLLLFVSITVLPPYAL